MSTKDTIDHDDNWHLYRDIADDYPEDIHLILNRRDYDGSVIADSFRIPWKAAVALHEFVGNRLDTEASHRDPVWLRDQIEVHKRTISEHEGDTSITSDLISGSLRSRVTYLQNKLEQLESTMEGTGDTQ